MWGGGGGQWDVEVVLFLVETPMCSLLLSFQASFC